MALKVGNFNLDRLKLSNLYSAYFGLSPREQTIALIAAAVVVVLMVILPVAVASGRITKLEKDVLEGKKQLTEIMRTIESYDKQKAKLAQVQQLMSGGFDSAIRTTLETLADTNGIKDRIDSFGKEEKAPADLFNEIFIDVRIKKVSLQQLVDFLYAIEHQSGKLLRLKQLTIKSLFSNKQDLDSVFTVSTYQLVEGAEEGGVARPPQKSE